MADEQADHGLRRARAALARRLSPPLPERPQVPEQPPAAVLDLLGTGLSERVGRYTGGWRGL